MPKESELEMMGIVGGRGSTCGQVASPVASAGGEGEEAARNVRALIRRCLVFVGLWNTLARTEQCQVRWAGPATPIQIQIRVQVLVAQRGAAAEGMLQ